MSDLAEIRTMVAALQLSTGRIEGAMGSMLATMNERGNDIGKLEDRMGKVENRQAWYAGGITLGSALFAVLAKKYLPLIAVLTLASVTVAQTQTPLEVQPHKHPPKDAEIHSRFYESWMRPDMPTHSCCNKQDCYPTEFKKTGGTWFAQRREDGEWIPIPADKLEHNRTDSTPRDNPDGRNHVCMSPPGGSNTVYCAILGSGL